MTTTRRQFLNSAWAIAAAAAPAYGVLASCTTNDALAQAETVSVQDDPLGFLDLPPGFAYQRLSETGMTMSDGFRVPARHDGMGAFAVDYDPDLCVLIRNHEINLGGADTGPFGKHVGVPASVPRGAVFDIAPDGDPLAGGTTTLVYNTRTRKLERDFLSLIGTDRNCSGSITPWGTWLTCEESRATPGDQVSQLHGCAFEVRAAARGLVKAEPLRAMGRFNRDGCGPIHGRALDQYRRPRSA